MDRYDRDEPVITIMFILYTAWFHHNYGSSLADSGFEVWGGGGSSGIHKSQSTTHLTSQKKKKKKDRLYSFFFWPRGDGI